jgi:hypothetical protein
MKDIQAYIDSKQQEFERHPFFALLEKLKTLEEIGYFVPDLTFWVMAFQDILRLNKERVTNPYLRKIAHHHKLEDAGHEQWFLHDKNYVSSRHASTREDVNWLIESSGHVFFDKIVNKIQELGEDKNLKYFARSHLDAELAHALFDEEMERELYAEPLTADIRRDARALVDRCYNAFNKMFDGLIVAYERQLELA